MTRDGRLTAIDIDVAARRRRLRDAQPGGAVARRHPRHAAPTAATTSGSNGRAVMTNTPPNGAFRGFGAPQTQFAAEVHMERVAERLGIDPVRLRERNALRPGDTTATGQVLGRDTSALEVLREAVKRTDFRRRRRAAARHGSRPRPRALLPRRGLHRLRRGAARLAGLARADRARRAHPGVEHRDRPGRADGPRADRRRHARPARSTPIEVARADTAQRARQRPDGGLAHDDGRRRPARSAAPRR